MKKVVIYLLFLLPLAASAQFENLKVSFILGPNLSWMGSNDSKVTSDGANLGFKMHVLGEYLLNDRYSFTGGLGLSFLQGGKLSFAQGGNLWSEAELGIPKKVSLSNGVVLGYRVNYAEIPFGFKMRTDPFGKWRFYANVPEFSIGLKSRARGSIDKNINNSTKENISKEIAFLNISWAAGIGTEYSLSDNLAIIAGIRYFQSITDITDDSGRYFDGSKEDSKGTIYNIDFRIGVLF